MKEKNFVDADGAACPSDAQHRRNEKIRCIGNSAYSCDCGCDFEWYDKHSWYIIKHSDRYGVPEQYDLKDEDEPMDCICTKDEDIPVAEEIVEKQAEPSYFSLLSFYALLYITFITGILLGSILTNVSK